MLEKQLYGPDRREIVYITVVDHKAEVFRTRVEYSYSNRTPDLTEENAMEVLKCADEYQITDLVVKCQVLIQLKCNTLQWHETDWSYGYLTYSTRA